MPKVTRGEVRHRDESTPLNLVDVLTTGALLRKGAFYAPKSRAIYKGMESLSEPRIMNMLTAPDAEYWKALRTAWMACFTSTNLKRVSGSTLEVAFIL